MLEKPNDLHDKSESGLVKQKYQSPELQEFGSITELTNSAAGSCQDDGNNCPIGPGTMIMGM